MNRARWDIRKFIEKELISSQEVLEMLNVSRARLAMIKDIKPIIRGYYLRSEVINFLNDEQIKERREKYRKKEPIGPANQTMKIHNYPIKTEIIEGREYIQGLVEDTWFLHTREEIVRQNVLRTLHFEYGYPKDYIIPEFPMDTYNNDNNIVKLRADIAVVLPSRVKSYPCQPYIIVECKNRDIDITEDVLEQGLRYCKELIAYYLVLTNEIETFVYCVESDDNYYLLDDIPTFEQALAMETWLLPEYSYNENDEIILKETPIDEHPERIRTLSFHSNYSLIPNDYDA